MVVVRSPVNSEEESMLPLAERFLSMLLNLFYYVVTIDQRDVVYASSI